jgi:maltooligosyltrehalose trehalohydrolase
MQLVKIGAVYLGQMRCSFTVWAPLKGKIEIVLYPFDSTSNVRRAGLRKGPRGYWHVQLDNVPPGTRYAWSIDGGKELPDPASHYQPDGVHNPSVVVDHSSFRWSDERWNGIPLESMILYELHVGTFSREGTFDAIIPRLNALHDVGINTIEIMPVAQFPGARNWGYDGVYPFAVHNTYGGPDGLKRFVDACHSEGMAVILDVVYNHLGPEGNYLALYAPYFTEKYATLWGSAINFDDAYSDEVRNYYFENALHWFEHYHIDGLRLDAVHAIFDASAKPFLQELAERTDEYSRANGKTRFLIAESNLNDARLIRPRQHHGFGLDAQWNDDFHHSVRTILTGDRNGYYADFGSIDQLAKAIREGYVYTWEYSDFRKRRHGNSSADQPGERLVIFTQNHDQVGNRLHSERPSTVMSFEALKLAAGMMLMSPYVPMIFMGEEYAEETPFNYFISHSDPKLVDDVRQGRKEEFKRFAWAGEPPDPASEETFRNSILRWDCRTEGRHRAMVEFYRELIRLRRTHPALRRLDKQSMEVTIDRHMLTVRRWNGERAVLAMFNVSAETSPPVSARDTVRWTKLLDSTDAAWAGLNNAQSPEILTTGKNVVLPAWSFVMYDRTG